MSKIKYCPVCGREVETEELPNDVVMGVNVSDRIEFYCPYCGIRGVIEL